MIVMHGAGYLACKTEGDRAGPCAPSREHCRAGDGRCCSRLAASGSAQLDGYVVAGTLPHDGPSNPLAQISCPRVRCADGQLRDLSLDDRGAR